MKSTFIFSFVLFFSVISVVKSQEKKDSIYYKIENFSEKRKSTRFLYQFIFRETPDTLAVKSRINAPKQISYDGKIIRNIKIETIDPFGYEIAAKKNDSNWYNTLADKIHIASKKTTINDYLLFQKGEKYNAQKLYESERVLRNAKFVNRVNISVVDSSSTKDSIDVLVKVLDSWSLKPRFRYSANKIGIGVREENLLGLGHEINFLYTTNSKEKQNEIFGSYTANNILGTFINATIVGEKDFDFNERLGFGANRDFFSPLTRWAGGFSFEYFMRKVWLPTESPTAIPEAQIKVYNQDLWGGYQFPVFINDKNEISRNIAILGRFTNYQYKDRPPMDKYDFFSTYTSFLASLSFTERKFSVQRNIFQYNLPEDVPYGKSLGFTAGILKRSSQSTPYAGISGSLGSFIHWGYFNVKAEYGRFFNENKENSNAFRLDGTYFTNLHDWKFAKVRHFFSPTFAIGSERYNFTYKDRINFSAKDEFPAYSPDFIGTKKLILRYQMQLFIDKTWKNFHFSPYSIITLGWLSPKNKNIFNTTMNSKFGLGVLIDNPYLIFNRIQFSFVFYPKIPFDNKPAFEFNDYRNSDMSINSFATDIPHFVNFQN